MLLDFGRPDRDRNHFIGKALLANPDRFLERDLAKRVDAHFDPVRHDPAAVGLEVNADAVVDDALESDEYAAHASQLALALNSRRRLLSRCSV